MVWKNSECLSSSLEASSTTDPTSWRWISRSLSLRRWPSSSSNSRPRAVAPKPSIRTSRANWTESRWSSKASMHRAVHIKWTKETTEVFTLLHMEKSELLKVEISLATWTRTATETLTDSTGTLTESQIETVIDRGREAGRMPPKTSREEFRKWKIKLICLPWVESGDLSINTILLINSTIYEDIEYMSTMNKYFLRVFFSNY